MAIWRYYVEDDNGDIEMEIASGDKGTYTVHYPRFEYNDTPVGGECTCFMEFRLSQLGMLLFAYSEREYNKFYEFLREKARA